MNNRRRRGCRALCLLLTAAMLFQLLPLQASATAADDQEYELLGELASRYEGGDAGAVVNNSGDIGGKSYGAYQFASASGTPLSFALWCQESDNEYYQYIGQTLEAAYYKGGAGYGSNFDNAWKALAEENYDGFLACQRYYVNAEYYESIVEKVEADTSGFDIHNYSIALRNVFLSRAIQHGVPGARQVIGNAFAALGGFANQPETEIINAIYAESSKTRLPNEGETKIMTGTTADKYGVSGQVLHYYRGSSPDIQLGVFLRLRFNEPAKAQNMLVTYGYVDAPAAEGLYRFSPAANAELAVGVTGTGLTLNTADSSDAQRFRLTYYASGYYIIESVTSDLRLTAQADGSVTLAEPTVSNNQFWKLENMESGFSVCNRETGLYLTGASAGASVATGAEAMQWQMSKSGSAWSLDGASYPTYANLLHEGNSSFPFRGTLRCTHNIDTVTASILTASGTNATTPGKATGINATSYNLANLDGKMAFSKLKAGSYKVVIQATSSEAGTDFYLESPFFVTDGTYILTFDPCGGTVSETARNLAAGQAFGALPTPEKEGYLFTGWFTAAEGGEQVTASTIATGANQTVYAHYEKAYTYAFRNYDGTEWAAGTLALNAPIPAPAENPTRPADEAYYYVFTGWEGYTEGMTITEDVVFTAQYEQHELEILPEITTDAYTIRDGYLRAIAIGTTPEALLNKLVPSEFITVTKGSAATETTVATGMEVVYAVGGETFQTLTVVVTGDVNGDGAISITDLVQINNHLLKKSTLTGAAASAADVNADGVISITDLVQVNNHLLKKSTITPN
ncbi:MAG: hypothetical protein E7469_02970 [Ruminococcaceae bacterium]|nr:hypothetical protein [Oscillospiraceae bacterium]